MIIWLLVIALSNGLIIQAEFHSRADCEAGKIEIIQNDSNTKVGKCRPEKPLEQSKKSDNQK